MGKVVKLFEMRGFYLKSISVFHPYETQIAAISDILFFLSSLLFGFFLQ
jgi:hypothetical protein